MLLQRNSTTERLLRDEEGRRQRLHDQLSSLTQSRLLAPLRWFHRLTGRGPDFAQVDRILAADGAAPIVPTADITQGILDDFHRLYYDNPTSTWQRTHWMGTSILKLPLDMWLYQEYLHELRPDLVIECGTFQGGSALYMAHIMDLLGHGQIVTIDINERAGRPEHPRISYVTSSSIEPATVAAAAARANGGKVMVILDSDHSAGHVYQEMIAYAPHVSVGSLMIVEDTNVHGHPVHLDHPAGPWEAVDRFLAERDDFVVEPDSDRFLVSFNPRGVLRRVR